jgi:hypothetical protein
MVTSEKILAAVTSMIYMEFMYYTSLTFPNMYMNGQRVRLMHVLTNTKSMKSIFLLVLG